MALDELKSGNDVEPQQNGHDISAARPASRLGPVPTLQQLIYDSGHHWRDLSYFGALAKNPELTGRKKHKIKTVALYYHRLHDGGTERVTSRLATIFQSLGYRVILLTDGPPNKNDYCGADLERFSLPGHREKYVPRGTALAEILRRENVDVFINNQWVEVATIWDMLVAKRLGIPVVIGWHNVFDAGLQDGANIDLFRLRLTAYRYADLVTVLTAMDQYWFFTQNIAARLVHNPLTFEALPPTTSTLASKTILWIGRVEEYQKHIFHAVRMLAIVLQRVPDATLLVVGDGAERAAAQELAASLGLSNHVKFVGYQSDVAPFINFAAVHVMTSQFEGAPMVLGEVWSHGVPTVMYDLSYLEFLREGKGHICVEQNDIDALAAAVVHVLKDDPLRLRLGAEARGVAVSRFAIDLRDEWRRIFNDIEEKDDLGDEPSPESVVATAPLLVRQLVEKLYASDGRVQRHWSRPTSDRRQRRREFRRRLRRRAYSILMSPIATAKSLWRLRPVRRFKKLRTIDLSRVGLGDNLMIWTGLYTLLDSGLNLCELGCVLYVPHDLVKLSSHLFARFGLVVKAGSPQEPISPLYSPLPPETLKQCYGAYFGVDWRMNWVEALDLQKTFRRLDTKQTAFTRLRLRLSERILYKRKSWKEARPEYIGYRVWLPVAEKCGLKPLRFMVNLKQSLQSIREEVATYVDNVKEGNDDIGAFDVAVFPTGKSFQAMTPDVCKAIAGRSKGQNTKFFIPDNDPWITQYAAAGINPKTLKTIDAVLTVIKSSRVLLTTDSFSSHAAQLLRDDFVLVLTRDFRENIVHPAANPKIVANHPGCSPCNYHERSGLNTCVAGFSHCVAFDSSGFVNNILASLKQASA